MKQIQIQCYMTAEERDRIREASKKVSLPMSAFIRTSVVKQARIILEDTATPCNSSKA